MENDLSVDSVCEALVVADGHESARLKAMCLQYITSHFNDLHTTDEFKQLPRHLLDHVHEAIAVRLSRLSVQER